MQGLCFGKGNLTSNQFIQTGSALLNHNVYPQAIMTGFTQITFPVAFSSVPTVNITRYAVNGGLTGAYLIMGVYNISTTGFYIDLYNSSPVTIVLANAYGYSYSAIGGY
jgi:hypothetical protein